MDLRASLERPAPDAGLAEPDATVIGRFKVSGPAEIWTRKILDTNTKLDLTLAARLGSANWQRYQRVSKKMEDNEDVDRDSEEEEDQLGSLPLFSVDTMSTKEQSSVFSSSRPTSSALGATTATSVSQTQFEYTFPVARKRAVIAKDTRSQATYTSVVTNDRGERGWLRIPPLPIKVEELGKPFRCTICGDKLYDIMNRSDWKFVVLNRICLEQN